MTELVALAAEIQEICRAQDWQFCFIGGLVVQEWSRVRMTDDVDLSILTGFGGEDAVIEELLKHYEARRADARAFALRNRVLLLRSKSGVGIDVAMAALPFEEETIRRAKDIEYVDGIRLRICTADDLVVMKAFANRIEDWRDVRMTIVKQGAEGLDWKHIVEQLRPLAEAKEEPEIVDRLLRLRDEVKATEQR